MRFTGKTLQISASDLANHLACRHITTLDLQVIHGEIKQEFREDPRIDALIERGKQHEAAYLAHLEKSGLKVLRGDGGIERTIAAMKDGVDVIAQAYLSDGQWHGRADVLRKVNTPSKLLGDWSYEVYDTKLSRETKGGTILQLCLYSELVGTLQGKMPEYMHVITPGSNHPPTPSLSKEGERHQSARSLFKEGEYRVHDFLAYHRYLKSRLEYAINTNPQTYPEAVEHCDICFWWPRCNQQRRHDDHLSFVAGISKLQIRELHKLNVDTLASLASTSIAKTPERGSMESYERIQHQACLQLAYRNTNTPVHDLLDLEPERGLARLPEPSPGDIFFDFESDPFVEEG